jgi:hypothetical protein
MTKEDTNISVVVGYFRSAANVERYIALLTDAEITATSRETGDRKHTVVSVDFSHASQPRAIRDQMTFEPVHEPEVAGGAT